MSCLLDLSAEESGREDGFFSDEEEDMFEETQGDRDFVTPHEGDDEVEETGFDDFVNIAEEADLEHDEAVRQIRLMEQRKKMREDEALRAEKKRMKGTLQAFFSPSSSSSLFEKSSVRKPLPLPENNFEPTPKLAERPLFDYFRPKPRKLEKPADKSAETKEEKPKNFCENEQFRFFRPKPRNLEKPADKSADRKEEKPMRKRTVSVFSTQTPQTRKKCRQKCRNKGGETLRSFFSITQSGLPPQEKTKEIDCIKIFKDKIQ